VIPVYKRVLRAGASARPLTVSTRRHWTNEVMEGALQDVMSGKLSVRRAALQYDVPKSTLHDRVTGKVLPGAVGGPPRYLTDEEEEELVRWLEGCAEVGCAKSVREVKGVVGAIVGKKQNLEHATVSHGWWDRFHTSSTCYQSARHTTSACVLDVLLHN